MDPIVQRFQSEQSLRAMMTEIGAGGNEASRIIRDGFPSMERLVAQYKFKINEFEDYLKTLNKTFATASLVRDRLYYSPPVLSNLVGCLFYASTCYNGLHAYIDIDLIDADSASDYYKGKNEVKEFLFSEL